MSKVIDIHEWQARKLGYPSLEEIEKAMDAENEAGARARGFESFDAWVSHEFQMSLEEARKNGPPPGAFGGFVGPLADGPHCCVVIQAEHCSCGRMIETAASDHCIDCGAPYTPDPPAAA